MPEMNYNMVSTGPMGEAGPTEAGYIGGGMMQREDPVATPVITLDVPDIDAALESVAAHGGEVVSPGMAVGEMGFAAYFRDSEGNRMGLWQSAG
jgi:predicted enzyme related to lactoylglutathione lyase